MTLIKTLESLTDSAPAMYQYKHLSFQEGLFARDLLNLVDQKKWRGWDDDKSAAEFLNNAYMNNVCRIAAGELGQRLAKLRPDWDFSTHTLTWVGKSALWQLVNENPRLISLTASGCKVGPTTSAGSESLTDHNGLARLFSSCPRLHRVNLASNALGKFDKKELGVWTKALAGNASLVELDLQSNELGADGVKAVSMALLSCLVIKTVNLSRNMPGRNPEALCQLLREHKTLCNLSVVEDDEKHLPSKAKAMLGEAILANPAHVLHFVSCDAFELKPETRSLKLPAGRLAAEVGLLAGALRANATLTSLEMAGSDVADGDRQQLGKALLENEQGVLGYCDEFGIAAGATELDIDLKETAAARRGPHMLFGILRANRTLKKATLRTLSTEHIPLLAQAMAANRTLEQLQLDQQVQSSGAKRAVSIVLPIQRVTGAEPVETLDLSGAGELSRMTCAALGAMLVSNDAIRTLKLTNTKLGDEAGAVMEHLGGACKAGRLSSLDLSSIDLTDRGARKLFDSLLTGQYTALKSLSLAGNQMKDVKANGLLDMLRADDCSLTALDISGQGVSGAMVMRSLKFNASLTHLNVCGTEVDDEGMRLFGQMLLQDDCPCPIKLLACDHFAVLDDTRSLDFAGKTLSPAALTLLFGILKLNESVHSLGLGGVGMDVTAVASLETALRVNKTLEQLDLRDNEKLWMYEMGIDSQEGLEALARGLHANTSVTKVFVDQMEIAVQELKGADASKPAIDLSGKKALGGISMALVCLLMERNAALQKLDVSGNKQVKRLGDAVGSCLAGTHTIKEVVIKEADLRDEGATALIDGALKCSASRLVSLDLSFNDLGAASADAISRILLSQKSGLTKLDLTGNKLGPQGAAGLASGLSHNTTLTGLSLLGNGIEQEGAQKVATALTKNKTLTAIWLGDNMLKDAGTSAIVDALLSVGAGSRLAQLDLSSNGIGSAGLKDIIKLLSQSPMLTSLSLAGTKLEFTDTDALQGAAKENPELGRTKAVRLWMGKDNKNWPPL